MKKYLSFFRLRLNMGMQYRTAAVAGMVTQFVWGIMEVLAMRAFYESDPTAFPMTLPAACSYVWLQQAFLALFMGWIMENEIFSSILDGNIAYELVRPIRIYPMWYARSLANRLSKAALRCVPILLIALLVPAPYGLSAPAGAKSFLWFLCTMLLGVLVTVAFTMLIYMLSFFTLSPDGLRIVFMSVIEFCQGAILPCPSFLTESDSSWSCFPSLPCRTCRCVPTVGICRVQLCKRLSCFSYSGCLLSSPWEGFWNVSL